MAQNLVLNILAKDKTKVAFGAIKRGLSNLRASVFSVQSALVGIGGGLVIRNLINTGREIEQLEVKFNFLFQSTKKGAEAFNTLTTFAARVPFSLEQISAASGNLATITSVASGGAKELQKVLEITGNVAAVTGLDFRMTAEQIQRAFSGGIASADMFRERGVTAMLGFTQGVQVTAEETAKKFEEVFGKNGKFGKATEVMSTTFTGTLSMLGDKLFKFKMDTNKGGFFDFIKSGLALINRAIENNEKALADFAKGLSDALIKTTKFILLGSAQMIDVLRTPFKVVMTGIQGIFNVMSLLPPAVASMGLIGFLMLGTKGRLAILGIGFLIEKIGLDLDALAKKLGMNEKNTAEWGSATAALEKGFKELNSFMVEANRQTAEIYNEMNKAAKEAEKMKRNISPFRQEIEKLNEDSLKKLTNLSKQAFEIFEMGIKGMSKGIAESIVLGKEFGDTMRNIGNQILIKIISALIEVAVKIGVQIALQNTTIAQLLITLGIEKQITAEKDKQNKASKGKAVSGFIDMGLSFLGFAQGGAVSKGKPIMVGERGPELFVPNQTGQITQNARGTGGGNVNVNFNIEAIDSNSFNDVLVQNRGIITSIINNALNEKGRRELV